MGTIIEMGIVTSNGEFPHIVVNNREDARTMVRILSEAGIPVNIREVP